MSKDMPGAAPAPTARQMVQAPMGLRSAMKRYADGGDITVAPPMATSAVPDYSRAYGALGGAAGVNALRDQLLGMGISEDIIGSALSKYYAPEPQQGMSPQEKIPPKPARYSPEPPPPPPEPETARFSPDPETRRPPPPDEPRYEEPRYKEPRPEMPKIYPVGVNPERPDVRPVMPEVYPQDYAGPRTTGSTQPQQVGPRTSYRQEADGTMTEIGYDGQPISGYTAQQLAMHNATTGVTPSQSRYVYNGEGYDLVPNTTQASQTSYRQNVDGTLTEIGYDGQPISGYTAQQTAMDRATRGLDPSEFQYVYNGQGYDKVRTGGVTMDDGTFIAGADNGQGGMDIGGPAFFQKYADDPMTMARLREMYGFTGAEPEYQQPEIGFTPNASYQENVAPQIPFNPADIPVNGYNEPDVNNVSLYDSRQNQAEKEYERVDLLKRAMQGQGVGGLENSQKLAQLLRSLGYSK